MPLEVGPIYKVTTLERHGRLADPLVFLAVLIVARMGAVIVERVALYISALVRSAHQYGYKAS